MTMMWPDECGVCGRPGCTEENHEHEMELCAWRTAMWRREVRKWNWSQLSGGADKLDYACRRTPQLMLAVRFLPIMMDCVGENNREPNAYEQGELATLAGLMYDVGLLHGERKDLFEITDFLLTLPELEFLVDEAVSELD